MKFLPRIHRKFVVGFSLLAIFVPAMARTQTQPKIVASAKQEDPAAVSHVKVILENGKPAIEITSDRPVVPTITKVDDPPRLIIDLPNTNMAAREKSIEVQSEDISHIRLRQFLMAPPVARVTIDLKKALSFTWEATAGNKLIIHLHAESEAVTSKAPSVDALTKSNDEPVAVPVSRASSGNVVFADKLASGAAVSGSAKTTTVLRLARGGEIHVCPGTTVSVTRSQNGHDLMVGMSTGALETHYALDESADAILTPDFRILLRGPGEFHYAIRADSRGNTCMRTLPGNTAPALVSELMGDGSYELQPNEQLIFHSGHVNAVDTALHTGGAHVVEVAMPTDCGCPAQEAPMMLASADPVSANAGQLQSLHLGQPDEARKSDSSPSATPGTEPSGVSSTTAPEPGSETAPLPPSKPNEKHVHIDIPPIVYQASAEEPAANGKTETVIEAGNITPIAATAATEQSGSAQPAPAADAPAKRPHRGFFGKIKGMMARIF